MPIYTRTGDDGTTGRPGGRRVQKTDPRVEANGAVDELNSHLGLCRRRVEAEGLADLAADLRRVQENLLTVGAVLATVGTGLEAAVSLGDAAGALEARIDAIAAELPELTRFVLPGGTEAACQLHVARTVCRRAERAVLAAGEGVPADVRAYVNRLSDFLFVAARRANIAAGGEDEPWRP